MSVTAVGVDGTRARKIMGVVAGHATQPDDPRTARYVSLPASDEPATAVDDSWCTHLLALPDELLGNIITPLMGLRLRDVLVLGRMANPTDKLSNGHVLAGARASCKAFALHVRDAAAVVAARHGWHLLNKLAPDNFEKLTAQFLDLDLEKRYDMVLAIDMIFDKALVGPLVGHLVDEPDISPLYAMLIARCADKFPQLAFPDERNPEAKPLEQQPLVFKQLLLNKCQEEFDREKASLQDKLRAPFACSCPLHATLPCKGQLCQKATPRMLGHIGFVGELYKQSMVTISTVHECLIVLLAKGKTDNPDEREVECLCKLMTRIGKSIDNVKTRGHMNEYFSRMLAMSRNERLPNRARSMLQETIDLRRGNWDAQSSPVYRHSLSSPSHSALWILMKL